MVPIRRLTTIHGEAVDLMSGGAPTHIQFRRFAGCPVCSLHLRSFVRRWDEVSTALREVVLFHSEEEELRRHAGDLPFLMVADPQKAIYRAFQVEAAPRALLDLRVWPTIPRAVVRALPDIVLGRRPAPSFNPEGSLFGLPADFLVGRDGRIAACKYGAHADDQWSVDEVLSLAGQVC
jgi:peroxiredoxin